MTTILFRSVVWVASLGASLVGLRPAGLAAIVPLFGEFIFVLLSERRRSLPDFVAGAAVVYDH